MVLSMNVTHRIRQRVLDSSVFVAIAKRILPRADVRLYRLTNGRFSLTPKGAQVLLLTTTGRRSGDPRVTPLIYTVDGDGYFVVGSNWGEPGHPAWVLNLLANPEATIEVGSRQQVVNARLLTGAERTTVWQRLIRSWPLYADLAARAGDRELPVVSLRPA